MIYTDPDRTFFWFFLGDILIGSAIVVGQYAIDSAFHNVLVVVLTCKFQFSSGTKWRKRTKNPQSISFMIMYKKEKLSKERDG